jgi:hypothetical protein
MFQPTMLKRWNDPIYSSSLATLGILHNKNLKSNKRNNFFRSDKKETDPVFPLLSDSFEEFIAGLNKKPLSNTGKIIPLVIFLTRHTKWRIHFVGS